jgi:hypothetical protein
MMNRNRREFLADAGKGMLVRINEGAVSRAIQLLSHSS